MTTSATRVRLDSKEVHFLECPACFCVREWEEDEELPEDGDEYHCPGCMKEIEVARP